MGNIRILPDILVSRIAAGEVVERPASVVKELLENSVDAGSSKVSVYLKSGGKKLIRVVDNGSGMSRDDALMSLERHATSKINDVDDLFSLDTLGFRGEALPSIASVSRFTLKSKVSGRDTGTEIYVDGGVIRKVSDSGIPEGTTVEVKNLFFNTKPRLKFLRKPETELLRITKIIQREAICRPEIAFSVFSEEKEIYHYPSRKSQIERISQVIPNAELFSVDFEGAGVKVSGYMSGPLENRTSMHKLYTYVNGRPVRDRFINRAVMSAYGNLIEKGRYPQGVLFISVDPRDVDVNVHPTKSEVKFQNQYQVGDCIKHSIKQMLAEAPWIKGYKDRSERALKRFYENQKYSGADVRTDDHYRTGFSFASKNFSERTAAYADSQSEKEGIKKVESVESSVHEESGKTESATNYFSGLSYKGQIGKLYLLCETDYGLIVVDQHAAHERVNFERIKSAYLDQGDLQSQQLLMPEVVELSTQDSDVSMQYRDDILKLGFGFENFGSNAVRIFSVPAFLLNTNYKEVFLNLLNEIDNIGEGKSLKESLDLVCATIACHGSVRANQRLSSDEVKHLFEDLDSCEFPHACPHGRPIVVEIPYNALEKMFRRT